VRIVRLRKQSQFPGGRATTGGCPYRWRMGAVGRQGVVADAGRLCAIESCKAGCRRYNEPVTGTSALDSCGLPDLVVKLRGFLCSSL
jgi:hypothetical protein